MEEAIKVPFNTGDDRDCNKLKGKEAAPGPGAYINISDPLNSSVCKNLTKYAYNKNYADENGFKTGAFGSTADRFYGN